MNSFSHLMLSSTRSQSFRLGRCESDKGVVRRGGCEETRHLLENQVQSSVSCRPMHQYLFCLLCIRHKLTNTYNGVMYFIKENEKTYWRIGKNIFLSQGTDLHILTTGRNNVRWFAVISQPLCHGTNSSSGHHRGVGLQGEVHDAGEGGSIAVWNTQGGDHA